MAHADYPPRDRLSLRAYIRARLRGRGLLEFADDDEEARVNIELVYMNCGQQWREDALRERTRLELQALLATTTDVPMQSIGNTVLSNDEFWSSTGSSSGSVGEALLYRLTQPLGRVAYASVAVYRANYQHGDPLYPSRKVSFLTGPTPNQLYPASPIYPVRLTDEQQVFALSPTAAVSQYLMVRLHGRRQRQWEDLQFYIAIRHVAAYGDPMDPSYGFQIARLAGSGALAWPSTRGLLPTAAAQGAGPLGGRGRGAGGASFWAPFGRQAGRASLDAVLPEDVYEAGPESVEESRRAYVTTAFPRRAPHSGPEPEPERGTTTAREAWPIAAAAGGQGCPVRPRAALPSGPAESELRQAVERAGLLRALPHLVHITWGEVLTARKQDQQPPPHDLKQQQHHHHHHRAPRGYAGDAQGVAGAGAGANAAGGWFRRAGGGPYVRPADGGLSASRKSDATSVGDKGSSGPLERSNDGGGAGGSGGAEAGAGGCGRLGPWQRLREWVVAAAEAAAGRALTDRDADPAHHRRARRDASSSGADRSGSGTSSGTSSRGSDPRVSDPAFPAALVRHAELLASQPAPRSADGGAMSSALIMRGEADGRLAAGGGAGAGGSVTAPGGAHGGEARHSRPEQTLPPPKLRRRGDGGPMAAAAGSRDGVEVTVAPGTGTAAGYGRVAAQRLRHHQRAAQLAMQTAVYSPARSGGHIFVALEAAAGLGGGGGGAEAAAAGGGDDAGSWLVSHYDLEHL